MEDSDKRLRPLTDGYVRQVLLGRLRKLGITKDDITPEMIALEREKLKGVRMLRQIKKITPPS